MAKSPMSPLAEATSSRKAAPEALDLYYSRTWHGFLLLVFAPPLVFYVYFLSISQINLLTVLFAPLALFCVQVCFDSVKALRWEGPVVLLDEFGITDLRLCEEAVPWRDVLRAELYANDAYTFLTLRLRDASAAKRYMGTGRFFGSWLSDWFMSGKWRTRLTSLRFKRREVLQRANDFIAHARRG